MGSALSSAALGLLLVAGPSHADVLETTAPGTNLGFLSDSEVQLRRDTLGFKRAFDGKVAIQAPSSKSWWDVKLDLKSPGTLLLRSPSGLVHYLAFSSLQQIDLSDDEVVGAIAGSGWEQGITPIEGEDGEHHMQRLELTREGFFQLISVVDP